MSNFTQELLGLINRNKKLKTLDLKRDWFEVGRTRFVPSNTGVERKDSTLNGPIYNPKIEPYAIRWADIKKGLDTTYDLTSLQDGANVDVKLIGTNGTTDIVKLVAGQNITLSNTGNQIIITSTGGGGGGGCSTEHMLIASHSGQFQENGLNNGTLYWIGDKECGWSGCTLTLAQTIAKGKTEPIVAEENFVGIPCPMDLGPEDIIKLCGIAYMDNQSGGTFGATLGLFKCTEYDVLTGAYPLTSLVSDNTTYTFSNQQVCWEIEYKLVPGQNISKCNSLFVVGLNTVTGEGSSTINFSYTLHITKNCSIEETS